MAVLSGCEGGSLFQNSLYSLPVRLPADGVSGGKIVLEKSLFGPEDFIQEIDPSQAAFLQVLKKERSDRDETWYFKSATRPGGVTIRSASGLSLHLDFYESFADADGDGFPDLAELGSAADRKNFTDWFVRIAESQTVKPNYSWNQNERDCSGLIRYAYREALKKHDTSWQKKHGILLDKNLADVKKFNYPDVPRLEKNIFKIAEAPAQDKSSFGVYADAEHLMKYNLKYISKDLQVSQKGDILFFFDESNADSPYHSMIVTQSGVLNPVIIYHTGSKRGIKRVKADYLNHYKKFIPKEWNRRFMGVYRFHIID